MSENPVFKIKKKGYSPWPSLAWDWAGPKASKLASPGARAVRFEPNVRTSAVSGYGQRGRERWDTDRWGTTVGVVSYLWPERRRSTPAWLPTSSGHNEDGNGSSSSSPTC